jgi:hypothetical protein
MCYFTVTGKMDLKLAYFVIAYHLTNFLVQNVTSLMLISSMHLVTRPETVYYIMLYIGLPTAFFEVKY